MHRQLYNKHLICLCRRQCRQSSHQPCHCPACVEQYALRVGMLESTCHGLMCLHKHSYRRACPYGHVQVNAYVLHTTTYTRVGIADDIPVLASPTAYLYAIADGIPMSASLTTYPCRHRRRYTCIDIAGAMTVSASPAQYLCRHCTTVYPYRHCR